MDMQDAVLAEVIAQMLAHGPHPLQLAPIDHIGVGKLALRPIDPHGPAAKRGLMPLRPPMNLIALRHRILFP